jgi:hypothetical protein
MEKSLINLLIIINRRKIHYQGKEPILIKDLLRIICREIRYKEEGRMYLRIEVEVRIEIRIIFKKI